MDNFSSETDSFIVFVWSEWNGPQQEKYFLWQQRYTFGARIKIMWEEQLVDPLIDYKGKLILKPCTNL